MDIRGICNIPVIFATLCHNRLRDLVEFQLLVVGYEHFRYNFPLKDGSIRVLFDHLSRVFSHASPGIYLNFALIKNVQYPVVFLFSEHYYIAYLMFLNLKLASIVSSRLLIFRSVLSY